MTKSRRTEDRYRPAEPAGFAYGTLGIVSAFGVFVLTYYSEIWTGTSWVWLVMVGVQVLTYAVVTKRAFRLAFAITTVVAYVAVAVAFAAIVYAFSSYPS
jgi:hypothetical protein